MSFVRILLLLAFVVVLGCKSESQTNSSAKPPSVQTIKSVLEQVANGGQPSSSYLAGMRMGIQDLKKADAAKAEDLDKDAQELIKLVSSNSKEAPAKAKEMLQKLDSIK